MQNLVFSLDFLFRDKSTNKFEKSGKLLRI